MLAMRPTLQPLQPTHAASSSAPGATSNMRVRSILIATSVVVAAAFATFASAPQTSLATPLASKQAQAAELDKQVSKIERRYDELQEKWRGAQIELAAIRADVADAHAEVVATEQDLDVARERLAVRAGTIYRNGGGSGDFTELVAAGSVSAFFDRLDTVRRVGDQDANVLDRIEELNAKVEKKERRLKQAKRQADKAVARARAAKSEMGKVLAARQAKLDSVNADIQAIMEEQRRAEAARAAAAARESASLVSTNGDGAQSGTASSSAGSSSGGSSIPLPPGSSTAAAAANAAMGKLGSPYVWAASGPDTFDCSGLVVWAFAQVGRSGLPHSTYSLVGMGVDVPLDQLQVGDLLFSAGTGHMGIYVGGGSFVHAPRSGDVVKVTSLSDYSMAQARRI